jgi:hypothetical protein
MCARVEQQVSARARFEADDALIAQWLKTSRKDVRRNVVWSKPWTKFRRDLACGQIVLLNIRLCRRASYPPRPSPTQGSRYQTLPVIPRQDLAPSVYASELLSDLLRLSDNCLCKGSMAKVRHVVVERSTPLHEASLLLCATIACRSKPFIHGPAPPWFVNGTDAAATAITVSCPVWRIRRPVTGTSILQGINFLIFLS